MMAAPKQKLLYLSSMSAPQQVKFCAALQQYFDATFWFCESALRTRGAWWDIEMGQNCAVLDGVVFGKQEGILEGKYWVIGLRDKLARLDPDIVLLGGFSIPANYRAYRWARRNGKRIVVFTERSRDRNGILRKRGPTWRLLRWLYRDVDLVMVSAEDALAQFRDEFMFGDKVVAGRYAADLDDYMPHPIRKPKGAYTYLYANRMTEIYNPIGALEIFAHVHARYPGSKLLMNADGELSAACRQRISELGIESSVEFLTSIQAWSDLPAVYERSDILLLPANFSNGNFTILEAMASGMGVVVSDRVLGIGKMVEDGKNGFNCEPTTEAFMNRIERYIKQPELLRVHAEINRSLVEPLSARGAAKFFAEKLHERLEI